MIIVGSVAMNLHNFQRAPIDIDLIASFKDLNKITGELKKWYSEVLSVPMSANKTVLHCSGNPPSSPSSAPLSTRGVIVEVEIAWPGSTGEDLMYEGETDSLCNLTHPYISPDLGIKCPQLNVLYTLKMSHRYLKNSPHFRKTHNDIIEMRKYGAKIWNPDWLKRREAETYTNKLPKLNVMKKDFFRGDGVQYIYDHDCIHQAMAHFGAPAYTFYMKDGEEVKSDKAKFFALSEYVRLAGVLEEAQVLALERSQIPYRGKVDPRKSFDIALQKVCTSITGGWFREFAWENFAKVESMYDLSYADRFWSAVELGQVKKV